ncbi:hypothetical protein E2C01_096342 [Portunus trituberculatus]|uniref:Uncharacterized protein n=1 Tax=Portunus trituberculatus TaxID=210409 RepID=A0A5B7JVD2_PORTR|nr:hypothetical protein [Portunus trituberculatus]
MRLPKQRTSPLLSWPRPTRAGASQLLRMQRTGMESPWAVRQMKSSLT